jgi:hypothetical protein
VGGPLVDEGTFADVEEMRLGVVCFGSLDKVDKYIVFSPSSYECVRMSRASLVH